MNQVATKAKFKLGVTLYSFAAEWAAGQYTLESMLARVEEMGIGPGVEIMASQTVRTYPETPDSFVKEWLGYCDKYNFEPSAYGTNLDMGRNRAAEMTLDQEYEFVLKQIEAGAKMRFPVIKIQSATGELLTKLLPHAEKLNVKLGYEIHAPEGPNTDKIMKIRDTYAKFDSPLLGFVPDFSSTMFKMGRTMLQAFRDKGLDEPAIEKVQEVWLKDTPVFERITEFVGYLEGRGLDPNMLGPFGRMAFNMNGHIAVEEWNDIMPQIVHVHGKFFDMNPDGQVDAIDYPAHVRLLAEGGYDGYISSEWEGHAFADIGVMDPFVVVKQQQDLMKQYM